LSGAVMQYKVSVKSEDLNQDDWKRFVDQHPQGNVFQSPEMYRFYSACKNYKPVIVAAIDADTSVLRGILLALIQRESSNFTGYFTARTIIWGGPLINPADPQDEKSILNLLLSNLISGVSRKSIYIQFRNLFDLSAFQDIFSQYGFSYHEHLNIQIDTAAADAVKKNISSSKLRQIKKSLAAGAEIIEAENIDQVKMFYLLLKDLYRQKVKRPLPDWKFFEQFYLAGRNNFPGKYFLIKYKDEIIGGIMCPFTAGKAIYEWYVTGLDGKYDGVYPSVLATWAPIDYALKNGLRYFDFMGAGKPGDDYGVREFKSKFGGTEVNYGRFERINHPAFYRLGKLGIALLKKL
jgi:serine/alanine adding enzyme